MTAIRLHLLFKYILIFICLKISTQQSVTKVIQTVHGPVRGEILTTAQKHITYSAFKGIPYAQPPVGKYRFQPPQPPTSWTDILDTSSDPDPCPQIDFTDNFRYVGNEDCLYLNVYTPETKFDHPETRAVMIWIHGGAFIIGSNNSSYYGPDFLIEEDVVVVAMNYRLGALGFMSLAVDEFSGNAGLKDQAFALQWTQDNIAQFGGDPNKVTIFGESAGGVAVELHHLSPLSQGLFRASIAMSGSPLNTWGFDEKEAARRSSIIGIGIKLRTIPLHILEHTSYYLNILMQTIKNFDLSEAISALYDSTAESLARLSIATPTRIINRFKFPILFFQPTNEVLGKWNNPFLTDEPLNLYKSGNFYRTPHILGYMKNEAASFLPSRGFVLPTVFKLFEPSISSNYFEEGIDELRKFLIKNSSVPVYYYRNAFNYSQALHNSNSMEDDGTAGHADDIAHIFYVKGKNQSLNSESDIAKHRNKMVTMWTNFAKYLDPTAILKSGIDVKWPKNNENGLLLEMGTTFKVLSDRSRRSGWLPWGK